MPWDRNRLHSLLSLNLVKQILNVLQALAKDREELTVTEADWDSPIDIKVSDSVGVSHLNDYFMKASQG